MSDKFHSADCGLRHNQPDCTCGYKKPLSKLEQENVQLRLALTEAEAHLDFVKEDDLGYCQNCINHANGWFTKWRILLNSIKDK